MLDVHCIPVLDDNYVWLLRDAVSGDTAVVDPAVAEPVIEAAATLGWNITQIWNTHWHPDHTGGNAAIKAVTHAEVIGPAMEVDKIASLDKGVGHGDRFHLGNVAVEVIFTPGHTAGHILFHLPDERLLFSGDTLFPMGCGRLFEGSPEEMHGNMCMLAQFPGDTLVYCAHEYTVANGKFALSIEPDNVDIQMRMEKVMRARALGIPTVPTTIRTEKATNPFMRAISVDEFARLRTLKDRG